jgi:hypothetical protein
MHGHMDLKISFYIYFFTCIPKGLSLFSVRVNVDFYAILWILSS